MVVRRGIRSLLVTLALYLVSGGAVGYFIHHAHHGARGLGTLDTVQGAIREQESELAALGAERGNWERRVALMRDQAIDRDLLDERARSTLGRVHRNDVVVMGR